MGGGCEWRDDDEEGCERRDNDEETFLAQTHTNTLSASMSNVLDVGYLCVSKTEIAPNLTQSTQSHTYHRIKQAI